MTGKMKKKKLFDPPAVGAQAPNEPPHFLEDCAKKRNAIDVERRRLNCLACSIHWQCKNYPACISLSIVVGNNMARLDKRKWHRNWSFI